MTDLAAITGTAFEDTIDGYFPLRESLRQMLVRNSFDAALVFILHAPAMEIPGLKPEDPVPLYITQGHGCLLHELALVVQLVEAQAVISGVGRWSWWNGHRSHEHQFSDMHRLAEPAFLRGIQLEHVDTLVKPETEAPLSKTKVVDDGSAMVQLQSNFVEGKILQGRVWSEGRKVFIVPETNGQKDTPLDAVAGISCSEDPRQHRILRKIFEEI